MKVGDVTRTVISASKKKVGHQVVYKTYLGQHKGKPRYSSQTRHELAGKLRRQDIAAN